jgi:hypothetical protein
LYEEEEDAIDAGNLNGDDRVDIVSEEDRFKSEEN